MSRQRMHRAVLVALISGFLAGTANVLKADARQNTSAAASAATLAAKGFPGLTGAGITIGLNESGVPNFANNGTGTTLLANGNANLPAANVSWQAGSNNITNHASETSGVIVSTLAGQSGIATGASVIAGNNSDVTTGTVGGNPAGSFGSLHLQSLFQNTRIVNMSWGGTDAANPANNGNNYISPFVDLGAGQYNSLVVVAGNEGNAESPSDAYNIVNVGALGVRTNAANNLSYNQFATYNTSNATADGRIGVDLVAAGGDPFSLSANWTPFIQMAGNQGTRAAPPANGFINQFVSTAGGVITTSQTNPPPPIATFAQSDTYNSLGPAATPTADNSTASAWFQFTNGNGLLPNGTLVPTTIAGTSFAAPLVSGAGALLGQYANNNAANTNFARNATDGLDHRVLKAILMNGASNTNPDGTPLQYQGGAGLQSYTRAPAYMVGGNPVPKVLPAYFNNITVNAQSGLDPTLGAGELNVVNSLINFAAGEQGPGQVRPTGWDLETAPSGKPLPVVFNYDFTVSAGAGFNGTLAWDSSVAITANPGAMFNGKTTWQAGSGTTASSTLTRSALTDLDLYLFTTKPDGSLNQLTAYSNSVLDNVEHIYVPMGGLAAGTYELDVFSPASIPADTTFGVAWATVPEPASLGLLAFIAASLLPRSRRAA